MSTIYVGMHYYCKMSYRYTHLFFICMMFFSGTKSHDSTNSESTKQSLSSENRAPENGNDNNRLLIIIISICTVIFLYMMLRPTDKLKSSTRKGRAPIELCSAFSLHLTLALYFAISGMIATKQLGIGHSPISFV